MGTTLPLLLALALTVILCFLPSGAVTSDVRHSGYLGTLALTASVMTPHEARAPVRRARGSLDEDVRQLTEWVDPATAALHYVELVQNRSASDDCVRTSLSLFQYGFSNRSFSAFQGQASVATRTANLLSNLFLKMPNSSEVLTVDNFYYALVRVNVESDPLVFSSSVAFGRGETPPGRLSSKELFRPSAYRRGFSVETLDLAAVEGEPPYDEGNEWFSWHANHNYSDLFARKGQLDAISAYVDGKEDVVVDLDDGEWSKPYVDCAGGYTWVVTYSSPFFGRHGDGIVFKGVVTVSFDLRNLDINQCAEDGLPFSDTHKCDILTTECVPIPGMGFRRGAYDCRCKTGFYLPGKNRGDTNGSRVHQFSGAVLEGVFITRQLERRSTEETVVDYPEEFRCLPCKPGCESCLDDSPCYVEYNLILRSLVLGSQSFCTTITCVLALVVFRLRKSRVIACAMWVMLETILLGVLLIYQTVIIRYFEPTTASCLAEPWFREVGFAICYGAIILKIYRILAEFRTRKAHRVCVRDKDLLKYLLATVLVVLGYMAAWTAVVVDNLKAGYGILEVGVTAQGLKYEVCRAPWWDYVTEVGELLFLLAGTYLTYGIRNAKADYFPEKRALCWSIYIEAMVSFSMNVIRHIVWLRLDPDYIFLLYFLRCQMTVTVVLILIFGPKLWYHHRPHESKRPTRRSHLSSCEGHDQYPESMKLHEAIMSNGEVDFADINLADMDPEDIRSELRRVYTQLQILRNKTMCKDNPHISKRRGGRKATHRRFSLQPFHHKHKHHHQSSRHQHHIADHDFETTEVSRTPEESTASVEGSTIQPDGPSTRGEEGQVAVKASYK